MIHDIPVFNVKLCCALRAVRTIYIASINCPPVAFCRIKLGFAGRPIEESTYICLRNHPASALETLPHSSLQGIRQNLPLPAWAPNLALPGKAGVVRLAWEAARI